MHIVVGEIISTEKKSPKKGLLPGDKKVFAKEKRKNKHDRRESVRYGVFVSFSFNNNRRILRDRRRYD